MKQMTYDQMQKLWDETFPKNTIIFSMWEGNDDEDLVTPEVDFTSDGLIKAGEFILTIPTWKYGGDYRIVEGIDLDWKKLVTLLTEHNDGHHIFLEDIWVKENNHVGVFLGS